MPWSWILPLGPGIAAREADYSPGDTMTVMHWRNCPPFSVLICYEAIFPELARLAVRNGAKLLVNITNDGWFGATAAPHQHLAMAGLRSIENRVWLVRSANTGISAAFDPSGRMVKSLPLQHEGLFTVTVSEPNVRKSFYCRFGDVFAWGCVGIIDCFRYLDHWAPVEAKIMDPKLRRTVIRTSAGLAAVVILIWLMMWLESVTTMLMVAFIFAYLLDPAVQRLDSWGLRRPLSALLMLVLAFSLVTAVLLVLIPKAFEEISSFSAKAPKYFSALQALFIQGAEKLNVTLPQDWQDLLTLIGEKGRQYLPRMAAITGSVVSVFFKSTFHIMSAVFFVLLIPIITYYLLVSFDNIRAGVIDLIPPYVRQPVLAKLREIDLVLSGFVRGQLTIAFLLGILYTIGFVLIGIDLAVVLGVLSGILWIIPYVGTLFGLITGSLMALVKYGDLSHVSLCNWLDCGGAIGGRLCVDPQNRGSRCRAASGRVYDGPHSRGQSVRFCGIVGGHTGHRGAQGATCDRSIGVSQFLLV